MPEDENEHLQRLREHGRSYSKEQRERCARRLAAVFICETCGGASVDYVVKKYRHTKLGDNWYELAEIFLGMQPEIMNSIDEPTKRHKASPDALMKNMIVFKRPQ
jgi:hypothetical protein